MNKLSQKDLDALASVSGEVGELFDELDSLRERFAGKAQELLDRIAEAKESAREIMDDAALSAEEFHDEKSEKWQEGDRGQAYAEWRDQLRAVADAIAEDIETPEIQMPERPEWVDSIGDPDFTEFEFLG